MATSSDELPPADCPDPPTLHGSTELPVHWPTSPFFQPFAPPSPGRGHECILTLTDGREAPGELLHLVPHEDTLELRVPERADPVRVHLDRIRWIKLTRPASLIPDTAALNALGSPNHDAAVDKTFTISLRDGSQLEGNTRGFVKDKTGLFLFLVSDATPAAAPYFIPSRQIKAVRIGPLLGDTLVSRKLVSPLTVATALDKQTTLRSERIGEYLTRRAILSAGDLARSLEEQKRRPSARLGDVLVEAQLITPGQLQEALAIQSQHRERRLGDILIEMGAVSLRLIQVALADKLGIPYVDVREFRMETATLRLIDPAFAQRHRVLPLLQTGDSLIIAVENPLGMDSAQDLRFTTGLTIVPVMADPQDLKARIAKEYSRLDVRTSSPPETQTHPKLDVKGLRPAAAARPDAARVEDLAFQLNREVAQSRPADRIRDTDTRVSDNTLVRLVNKMILDAHDQGASDIHIETNPGQHHLRIRFRRDGDLEDYLELPPTYRNALISRLKIMSDLDIAEHRLPQDGKIEFARHGPLAIELRVAVIPTTSGLEDVVLRILGNAEPRPLDQLGFCPRDLSELQQIIARSYGLILICGPTGSGKTTSLHSILRHINRPDVKIWTAEDPVEITQPGLRQVQMQPKIGWTFANAMRAFLRADPDIIMVGEMRDAETTKIGIEASLTGHLVFSTLHTNSAAESIVRLLDLGMDPFNFSDALLGILAQRLARTLCCECKRARPATDEEISALVAEYRGESKLDPAAILQRWRADYAIDGRLMLYEAVGCDACRDGYKGRTGIYELLIGSAQVKHHIRSRAAVPQLLEVAQIGGMRQLRQDAIDKVVQGILDLTAARAASS